METLGNDHLISQLFYVATILNQLFDVAPFPMILCDATGEIKEANKRSIELFKTGDTMILSNIIGEYMTEKFMKKLQKSGGFVDNFEAVLHTAYGYSFAGSLSAQFLKIHGEQNILIGMMDISDRKEAEKKLKEANEEALNATKAKSLFLATMSHEIRTPMNGVLGMVDILSRTNLTRDQREIVDVIKQSSVSLLTIIDDILDLSKIEAEKLVIEKIPVRLSQIVEICIELVSTRIHENNIQIAWIKDKELPAFIYGDSVRLRQIILNLLSNAVKFTKDGFVIVRIIKNGDNIRFEVSDTGIGLSDEHIQKLFQDYSQANSSIARQFGGTGLGLQICKKLVQMMGGTIGVNSKLKKGSTFWFEIPLEIATVQYVEQELVGLTVLVIDSFREAQYNISHILRKHGATVINIENNNWKKLETYKFDAAIIDKRNIDKNLPKIQKIIDKIYVIPTVLSEHEENIVYYDIEGFQPPILKPARSMKYIRAVLGVNSDLKNVELYDDSLLHEIEKIDQLSNENVDILVAEDDAINRRVIGKQLKDLNYTYDIVSDGNLALSMLDSKNYKLLITDCSMPNMDGFELSREIRKREKEKKLPRLPIMALTANVLEGEVNECLNAGMDDYLSKPVLLEKLSTALHKWIPNDLNTNPIDLEKFANIFGPQNFNNDDLKEFLDYFKETFAENIFALETAIDDKDAGTIKNIAHKAKGAANNACTTKMHVFLQDIENHSHDFDMSRKILDKIIREYDRIKIFIDIL